MRDKQKYWLKQDGADVVKKLSGYHGTWEIWSSNPISTAWVRNTIAYYSTVLEPNAWDSSLVFEGEQGELVKMLIPQARSLMRQFIATATKQKLAFNCSALRLGNDVAQATRIGNALANQIVKEEQLDRKGELFAEQAGVMGMAFMGAFWRTDKGRPFEANVDGSLVYDGDLDIVNFSVFDVFFDYTIEDWSRLDWVEVRIPKNKWDLVAQYPELADKIMALPTARDWRAITSDYRAVSEDDTVYVYELYHKPTPALPKGRMLMYCDEFTIFHDGINDYGCIPIEPLKPEPIFGMGFGYPKFSDLLPGQEMLDHSFSAIATNQSAFAVQSLTVPRGAGVSVQQIQGMNFINFTPMQGVQGGGRPEALQLTQSSPETFKFIDILHAHMLEISSLNSAMRGAPPAGVTSGAAIATLTTNALEFITSFSKAWTDAMGRVMMHGINATRKFAKTERLVAMVGPGGKTANKKFVGTDLDPINSVIINPMNPVMLTSAGRSDLADKLMQTGLIKSPQEYISILEGEPVQKIYQNELSENDLISSENEAMLEGEPVPCLATDDHPMHIRAHSSLLNDPTVRSNAEYTQIVLSHIEEHNELAKTTDPFLMAMLRTGKMPEGGPPQVQAPPSDGMGGAPTLGPSGPEAQPAEPADDLLNRG